MGDYGLAEITGHVLWFFNGSDILKEKLPPIGGARETAFFLLDENPCTILHPIKPYIKHNRVLPGTVPLNSDRGLR